MSTKKEIKNYIDENLKKNYTKEQIKNTLLKSYPEKKFMRYLIERPTPRLLGQYKKFHIWLIVFVIGALMIRFFYGFSTGIEKAVERGVGSELIIGFVMGFVALILPVLFFIGLIKSRGWSYIIFFIYGLLNLLYSIPTLLMAFFVEIPVEEAVEVTPTEIRITAIILSLIGFIVYLGITILSYYCWKKIHPDYKIKNLFVASS